MSDTKTTISIETLKAHTGREDLYVLLSGKGDSGFWSCPDPALRFRILTLPNLLSLQRNKVLRRGTLEPLS